MCDSCTPLHFFRHKHDFPPLERTATDVWFMSLLRAKVTSAYSSLIWIPEAQQYQIPAGQPGGGQFISPKAVRDVIDKDIEDTASMMQAQSRDIVQAAQLLLDKKISKAEYKRRVYLWREEMRRMVKNTHLNYACAAVGGFAQMDKHDYLRVANIVKYHYAKLNNFAEELIADPGIALGMSAGRMNFMDRVELYSQTGRYTFESGRILSHKQQGFTEYKNIPHSIQSCDDCVEITAKGWRKIGTLQDIGQRKCGPADKCSWEFR